MADAQLNWASDLEIASKRIFLDGLNSTTTDESLRTYFARYGPLTGSVVCQGKDKGKGVVSFHRLEDALTVMARKHFLDGSELQLKRAIPTRPTLLSPSPVRFKPFKRIVSRPAAPVVENPFSGTNLFGAPPTTLSAAKAGETSGGSAGFRPPKRRLVDWEPIDVSDDHDTETEVRDDSASLDDDDASRLRTTCENLARELVKAQEALVKAREENEELEKETARQLGQGARTAVLQITSASLDRTYMLGLLTKSERENLQLAFRIRDSENDLQQEKAKNKDLQYRLEEQAKALDQASKKSHDHDALKIDRDQAMERIVELEMTVKAMQDDLEEMAKDATSQEETSEAIMAERDRIKEKMADLQQDLAAHRDLVAAATAELEAMTAERDEAKETIIELETSVAALQQQLEASVQITAELPKILETAKTLKEDKTTLEAEINKLRFEHFKDVNETWTKMVEKTRGVVKNLDQELAAAQEEAKEARKTVQSLKKEVRKVEKSRDALVQKQGQPDDQTATLLKEQEAALKALEAEKATLTEKCQERMDAAMMDKERELIAIKAQCDSLEQKLAEERRFYLDVDVKYTSLRVKAGEMHHELERLRDYAKKVQEKVQKIVEVRRPYLKLQKECKETKENLDAVLQSLSPVLAESIKELQAKLAKLFEPIP